MDDIPLPSSPRDEIDRPTLPDWCNVYDGLSDEEIEDLENTILNRADLTWPIDPKG